MSTFLIMSLLIPSYVYGQEETSAALNPNSQTPPTALQTIGKALDSSISRQLIKRMGEPGFYASKFLSLRKQVNNATCTTSEKIAQVGNITTIVGDVTTHAFDYFEGKKLQKKFEDKLDNIKKYQETSKKENKKVLEYESANSDFQLDTLYYLKGQAEIELKRAEMVSKITYVTVGLNVTSQILALQEALAEAGSFGALTAQEKACKEAQRVAKEAREAQARQALKLPNVPVPWYLTPFLYLAKGINYLDSTETYQTYRAYKKGINQDDFAKNNSAELTANNPNVDVGSVARSAAYTEEMLVDVITDVIKKWKHGKRDVIEEINNFNQRDKEVSGIMKFFKSIGAEEVVIRYAVRTLINTSMIETEVFSSTGLGRAVLYAHNAYIIHRTIEDNKAQVEFAEQKIAMLDKTIKEFEAKTTWMPFFNNLLDSILPAKAYAATVPPVYQFPKPTCMPEIVPNCNLKGFEFISQDIKGYFNALPKNIQVDQKNILTNNLALKTALNLATGKSSYDIINSSELQKEVTKLEKLSQQLQSDLLRNKTLSSQYNSQLMKLKNEVIFPASILAGYNQAASTTDFQFNKPLASVTEKGVKSLSGEAQGPLLDSSFPPSEVTAASEKNNGDKYEIETISTKEHNLFEIITNRYMQVMKREEL